MPKSFDFNPFTVNFDEISSVALAPVGSSPNSNAASIASDQTLTLQPADATNPGVVTTGTQTFAGNKTFTGTIGASNLSGTNTGDQTITLTGDVTGSGTGSFAATISANAVTNAKLAQAPTNTIKGNNTGGTANELDLTIAQVNTMLGDILANGTVAMTANLNLGSNNIINVTDPTTAQMAATKNYVDMSVAALQPQASVYAATTGSNISGTYLNGVAGVGATFVTTATGVFTVDGVTPPLNSRVLIKNQSSGFQNGIYYISTLGSLGVPTTFTRTLDYDTASDMNSAGLIPIINGTLNALTSWQQVASITTVGTDALVFTEFTANPSLYLLKANNLSDVASSSTSFNNISPMTTAGDIIYENATPSGTRLPIGTTGQLLTVVGGLPSWASPATNGTVTSVSVISANGLAGTVATATTTPAITLSTTITGILQGNGTAISAASTTGSGNVVLATSPTLVTPVLGTPTSINLTNGTALPLTTGVTGVLPIANGGTNLSTTPSNGQLLIGNGTNYTLSTITAGTGITVTNGSGSITIASSTANTTDIADTSFSAVNNTSNQNVTGFSFSTSTVRSFIAQVAVPLVATTSLYEVYEIKGIYNGTSWALAQASAGDDALVTFHMTNAGQMQVDLPSYAGFTSCIIHFRATTLSQ